MVQAGLLLRLDRGVMDCLADRLDVAFIPEQDGIPSVGALVVGDRTVRRRVLPTADDAGALAGVVVPDVDLQLQVSPRLRLIPGLPWRAVLDRLRPLSLIGWEGTSIGREAGAGLEVREPRNARLRTIYSGMTAIPANRDGRGRAAPLA